MLFSYFDERNRVTIEPKKTIYTMDFLRTYAYADVYEYHKITTKVYQYVGMNEATAIACQNEMLAHYRRLYTLFNSTTLAPVNKKSWKTVADVTCKNDGGHMWSVTIQVNEDQLQYWYAVDDPAQLGLWDNSLDFEDDFPFGTYFRISNSWLENQALLLQYQQSIEGFNTANLRAEKSHDGTTWESATFQDRGDRLFFTVQNQDNYMRLKYGNIYTQSIKRPERIYGNYLSINGINWSAREVDKGWILDYYQDFKDWDIRLLKVYWRYYGESMWNDITSQCSISANSIYTMLADKSRRIEFMIVYTGTESTMPTPFDPSQDEGDGNYILEGIVFDSEDTNHKYYRISIWDRYEGGLSELKFKSSRDGTYWDDAEMTELVETSAGHYSGYATVGKLDEVGSLWTVQQGPDEPLMWLHTTFNFDQDIRSELRPRGIIRDSATTAKIYYASSLSEFDYSDETFFAMASTDGQNWERVMEYEKAGQYMQVEMSGVESRVKYRLYYGGIGYGSIDFPISKEFQTNG